jgi:hypothetical protein
VRLDLIRLLPRGKLVIWGSMSLDIDVSDATRHDRSRYQAAPSAWARTALSEALVHASRWTSSGWTAHGANRQFEEFVKATGYVTFAEIAPSKGLSGRAAAYALCRLAGIYAADAPLIYAIGSMVDLLKGADWRTPTP